MGDQNEIFFSMLRHVHQEQPDIDWAFKTSLIFVKGFNAKLEQTAIDRENQIENILEYLNEAKPYHTNFSGLTEQQSATREDASLSVSEIINPKTTIHFDRVSCETDLPGFDTGGYDSMPDAAGEEIGFDHFDVRLANLNNAANRISIYYDPGSDDEKKSLEELMDCDFQGYLVSGGAINIDDISYDAQFFERFGYDVPVNEAFYEITSTPILDFTEYETLIDAATDTDDYGFINDAVTNTLDWGTIDEPVLAPASSTTFPLPFVIFETKKVLVYYDQADGSRALTEDPYTVSGLNVVFDTPPPIGIIIYIAVLDYDYLYDKVYVSGEDWSPTVGDQEITLDGTGFMRPHWDRNHPQELSPIRVLENLDIRVYTNQAQVLGSDPGSDPGYDESPYDTLGYDLAEDDISLTTGGGPDVTTESHFMKDIKSTHELLTRPQSLQGIFVFSDGLLLDETNDYTVSWVEPIYSDTNERDDHITNPRITLLSPPSNTTPITFMSYGFGGATVQKRLVEYDTNVSLFETGVTITNANLVFATVNGVKATITVNDSQVTINTPIVAAGSTVAITVFNDSEFTEVFSQEENGSVITLDNPSSSTVPGYMGVQAWDKATGFRLNAPYTKVHLAEAGEDTYASSAPSTGAFDVYLNGIEQTSGVDYNVVGTDIVFTSVPPLNEEIIIHKTGTGEFLLSTAVATDDTFTLVGKDYLTLEDESGVLLLENGDELLLENGVADASDLRVVTFPEDISMGMRTETYHGLSSKEYDVGNIPSENRLMWIYLDGVFKYEGVDYVYEVDEIADTRTIQFIESSDHTNSIIQITYFVEKVSNRPVGYRYSNGPKGEIELYRIADKHTTELMDDFQSGIDQVIRVRDAAVLGQPSPITVNPIERIPGRVWINNELVEFWSIDYSSNPHQLTNLRPGHNATSMGLTHSSGSKVIDASRKQLLPKKIEMKRKSRLNFREQFSGILRHTILGEFTDPTQVKVWVREATSLVNTLNPSDTELTVIDSNVFTLPGATTLVSDVASPSGSILVGDILRIQLNGGSYQFVTLVGDDASSVEINVEATPPLFDAGLTASVTTDIISFSHAGGGDLIIENQTGYALQDLFGGQTTGTVTTPTVTAGGTEGISINGSTVLFSGITLADVVADINNAAIDNIVARDKDDRLQIINLEAAAITLMNVAGTALTELGIASSLASTILTVNGTLLQAAGTRSSTKGSIWIDQERIEFGYYDPSITGEHIIGDFNRLFEGINPDVIYLTGKIIIGSKQELKTYETDYNVTGNQIKFILGQQPTTGSLIRIQNQPDTSTIVFPDEIQTSNTAITKFLQKAPGNPEDLNR